MTPTRLHECLAALHWSQRGLADILGMDERQVRRWAAGASIPFAVAEWLERLAVFHENNPAPGRN
jgi:transcriptional regulator with XRE-family HTH domain